ncbi:putative DNA polymerase delta catalytic subunit [Tilletiopsis washingtonensis]|uniref:DNA polymerase n=1 Tax=Tilletiopsis washingtonensis TaxID=58919 RepID=A0A316Z0T0_9BASI|nr:putative DNA polymerase delta catalytic subunit [Tilletiopsis washingtonensis]PWN94634.1 putative DNA polymerase delta catalytic subunit [Tilletiopsis washingtonensis]
MPWSAAVGRLSLRCAEPADLRDTWPRPALPPMDPRSDELTFQQIDIEEHQVPNAAPQIRIWGVTATGHSVLVHVSAFLPYFYMHAPRGFVASDCTAFLNHLCTLFGRGSATAVQLLARKSLMHYMGDADVQFLKISAGDLRALSKMRDDIERGEVSFRDLLSAGDSQLTYENIAYPLRFMIDKDIVGMNWLTLQPNTYALRSESTKISTSQIEVDVRPDGIVSHKPDGEWSATAPLRILSFDIECAGRKGVFPEAEIDPVIQIASMVTRQAGESAPFIKNVMTLNTCSPIVGTHVMDFQREVDLLEAWAKFVQTVDPDVVIGYNIANFDFPYLLDRAKALKATKFPYLGREKNTKTEAKDTHFSSKAYGTRDSKNTELQGRLQLDMLQVMQRDYKLRSYSLNSVSYEFLGEQKEDVHFSLITELQNGGPEARRRLAVYCLKDAYLPQRLMDKLMCFINYVEMARVTGVPFNYLLSRGQQIKVVSQLFRKANEDHYLVPAHKGEGTDDQYEGATVLEPKQGYYDVPIATLDFASLYPSIMMAHNLCYTTLLTKPTIDRLGLVKDKDYVMTPNNNFFVKPGVRKGLLPTVLEDLLGARKRAKADLKKETDPFKRAVLDGRQLALKVSANSVYGFTGATVGKLPCLEISMSVTAYGRQMIEQTKTAVESRYTIANGYEHDAEVVYGDTDSVMVKFGVSDLARAMELGAEAADIVSATFVKPIKLEFEKVYFPYLLISKKRYAGLYWTNAEKYDKMDTKGIETVRRDNCRLVRMVIDTCLRKMLIDRDVKGAEDFVKQVISDLLQNKIDLSQLVITKALAKADYAAKQAHVELAERMRKRDAGSAPALGDRVAYVIVKGSKGAAAYEKSEDPLYVLEHNIPIDTRYYLDNQLAKPLMRIFEPISGAGAKGLLNGAHTRSVQVATSTVGSLMKFAVKTAQCLSCRTPLPAKLGDAPVCERCRPKLPEIYAEKLMRASTLEEEFARLWTGCQRCSGTVTQDVLCSNSDCPAFYSRRRAQKDVEEAERVLSRFDTTW